MKKVWIFIGTVVYCYINYRLLYVHWEKKAFMGSLEYYALSQQNKRFSFFLITIIKNNSLFSFSGSLFLW